MTYEANIAVGIVAVLFTLGAGVFTSAFVGQFFLRVTSDHLGKWWALPVWMAVAIGIVTPCFLGSFVLAGYVAFRFFS